MSKRRFSRLIAAAGLTVAVGLPTASAAYPDAKVESQVRPNFGLLLEPPVKRHKGYRPWGGRRPGWYDTPPPHWQWKGPLRDVAFVDCAQARDPNEVNRALASLRPGGTLILRANGAACLDNVVVTKPVTIQGDGGRPYRVSRFGYESGRGDLDAVMALPVALRSRPGGPCLDIEIGKGLRGEVVLRDLVIEAEKAGNEACLYARNTDVRLERTVIRYNGDGAAVYLDGGSLTVSDSVRVDADTPSQAIFVDGGSVDLDDLTVTRAAVALQLEPGGSQPSRITRSRFLLWPTPSPAFGPASAGVVMPYGRGGGTLTISESKICGFGIGIWVQGANTIDVNRSLICRSGKGVYAAGGQITLAKSDIGAHTFGIHVGAGQVNLEGNVFYGARASDVFVEPGGALPRGGGNQFYSSNQVCSWRYLDEGYWGPRRSRLDRRRWGEWRYAPTLTGPYWTCRDPRSIPSYIFDDEESLGFGAHAGFYAGMEPWPESRYRVPDPYDRWDGRTQFWSRSYRYSGPAAPYDDRYGRR